MDITEIIPFTILKIDKIYKFLNLSCSNKLQVCSKREHLPKSTEHILKLMKGKALRKRSLYEKTAASVLLKLFISSNE